jgi:hypothetical protein
VRLGGGALAVALMLGAGQGAWAQQQQQDTRAQEMVRTAVQTELAADRDDHSHWEYKDSYDSPDTGKTLSWVVETEQGALKKKVEQDGRPLNEQQLDAENTRIQGLVGNRAELERRRKDGAQDGKRAENMLRMLPDAFFWKLKSEHGDDMTFSFVPDPNFNPPTMESRVFAAMAGDLVVDKEQHRIKSISGTLTTDVKFAWGLFGQMDHGGRFDVERRQLAPGIWQITESHVHMNGHALIFKSISEQEDEVKSDFHRVPQETTLEQAATILKGEPASLNARR